MINIISVILAACDFRLSALMLYRGLENISGNSSIYLKEDN